MSFTLNESVQNSLVDMLNTAFINNSDYPFIVGGDGKPDLLNTQIVFYRAFPKIMTSYPVGIVESPVIPILPRTFNNDLLGESWGTITYPDNSTIEGICYQTFGGFGELNFSIFISGNTASERERIADYVVDALRFSYRGLLESQSIDVVDVQKNGTTVKPYAQDYIYVTEIQCKLFSTWSETIWNTGTILNGVGFCNIDISTPDGLCIIRV